MQTKRVVVDKITWQAVIILLLASSFYLYEFIMQVAPSAIAQNLMQEFAIDATKLGIISGCFYYAYTPLQLTTGLLLDRYSTRVILTTVSAICSLGVMLFAYAPNLYIAVIARLIIGGASACAFIGVLHLAIRWVPPIYFALFAGIVETMGSIGGALGTKPFAILLKHLSWREASLTFAYIGFALTLLIALLVKDQPKTIKKLSPPKDDSNNIFINLAKILKNRETWSVGIYSFLIWAPVLGFAALWGAPFLRLSYNLDNIAATRAIFYIWLGIAFSSPLIGWLSDRIEKRTIIMSICAIVGAIAITIAIYSTNISSPLLNILMAAIGFASAGQTLSFALIKDNNHPNTSGTANGFNNMCVVAGGLLFPILIGAILDNHWTGIMEQGVRVYSTKNYQLALASLPICYLLAACTSIFGIKETKCKPQW